MPREVYTYNTTIGGILENKIPLAAPSSSIGTTLTNTASTTNALQTLYDNKKNAVGKAIFNKNNNTFENNIGGYVSNVVYLFDDGSYVMTLKWVNNNSILPNTKYVSKSISTGGKYAGKDVTVTLKSDSNRGRELILEYKN